MSNNNNNNSQINSKDFLIGTLIGGIVGASAALLLAPKSGKELRGDINYQATNIKDKSGAWKSTAIEKGTEWIDLAKDKTDTISQTVSKQSSAIVNKVKSIKSKSDIDEVLEDEESVVDDIQEVEKTVQDDEYL